MYTLMLHGRQQHLFKDCFLSMSVTRRQLQGFKVLVMSVPPKGLVREQCVKCADHLFLPSIIHYLFLSMFLSLSLLSLACCVALSLSLFCLFLSLSLPLYVSEPPVWEGEREGGRERVGGRGAREGWE